ncbi:MAG: sensor histidine kinase [Polyangiales bacterium]
MTDTDGEALKRRAAALLEEDRDRVHRRTDRFFAALLIGQWVCAIALAAIYSPYAWEGKTRAIHVHVYAAILLGGVINALPIFLAWARPGAAVTRYVIASAQMLWSALLIHLMGGRIETHFHVFGSLAFLSFYRDWKVIIPATVVVAGDHFVRGMLWPESVYGIANPEWWRFLEHAFWVVFEDTFLLLACFAISRDMEQRALVQAEVEAIGQREQKKSAALDVALQQLRTSQETLVRTEKLAAVGQLAASVGHELRNPLFAIRNANTFVTKRLDGNADPKVTQFLQLMERELGVCSKIIADLLDFARERAPNAQPCPLRPLVDEAISLVPASKVKVVNAIPEDLPVPSLDKDQFRQIIINLVQNAVEAMPAERGGEVKVVAEGGGDKPWRISVVDDGPGMPSDVIERVFEPLFTTKTKGTGLGLAIVSNMVKAHRGVIRVDSSLGRGSRFDIELPAT